MEKINYKPFDLEKAKQGAKIMTRDGRPARIICYNRVSPKYPICALVLDGCVEGVIFCTLEGKCAIDRKECCDLVMCPEKHEGWVSIFRGEDYLTYMGQSIWESKSEAIRLDGGSKNYITTIKVEWEE